MPILVVILRLLLRAAEAGTLAEIVETSMHLIGLIKPLITDTKTLSAVDSLAEAIQSISHSPAQPEDPAIKRAAPDHKFGGR